MKKVYMFSYQTMYLDLLKNNIEKDIEELVDKILGKLKLYNIIEIDDTYIVGEITSNFIYKEYGIKCAAMELI